MNYRFCWTITTLSLLLLTACDRREPKTKRPPPVVTVAAPKVEAVADFEDFTGRTDAVSTVKIRARVTGYLVRVSFKDGDIVKQGDLLYQIDPRPFQADVDAAKGAVEKLEAQQKLFVLQVKRYGDLAKKGAAAEQDYDEYLAKEAENIGALKSAKAQLEHAELNLGFTRITAPITGKISRTLLTAGNLVNADSTELTTIVSIDPMYAYFPVEEPTLLEVQRMTREGLLPSRREVPVLMGLADDAHRRFPLRGVLDFVNNTVDPQTGTIQVRGQFRNPYQLPHKPPVLVPGLFVRVRLESALPRQTILVSERAIMTDQGEKFVYVVDRQNKVAYRRITLGMKLDDRRLQAIESGLKPDDRVVVAGGQRVRPGATVETETVDMENIEPKQPS